MPEISDYLFEDEDEEADLRSRVAIVKMDKDDFDRETLESAFGEKAVKIALGDKLVKKKGKKNRDDKFFESDPKNAIEFIKGDDKDKAIVTDENGKRITMKELIDSIR
jgi:hypothetical protein